MLFFNKTYLTITIKIECKVFFSQKLRIHKQKNVSICQISNISLMTGNINVIILKVNKQSCHDITVPIILCLFINWSFTVDYRHCWNIQQVLAVHSKTRRSKLLRNSVPLRITARRYQHAPNVDILFAKKLKNNWNNFLLFLTCESFWWIAVYFHGI